MNPGIHSLTFAQYLALDAWGSSSLRAMRRGPPARVMWERENQNHDTSATRIGSAAHCLFLTPDEYDKTYRHKSDGMSFATKEGKAWRAEVPDGVVILTHDESLLVGSIVKALLEKLGVKESLDAATHTEASLTWTCGHSGELCKGRPDWIEGHHIYDLKASRHAEGKSLAYRAYVEGWLHQLAHNRTGAQALGLDVRGGRLVVVSPVAPHYVYLLECKVDALDLLELENAATLKAMRECRISGVWAGTEDRWTLVEPPASAIVAFGEMTWTATEEESHG